MEHEGKGRDEFDTFALSLQLRFPVVAMHHLMQNHGRHAHLSVLIVAILPKKETQKADLHRPI